MPDRARLAIAGSATARSIRFPRLARLRCGGVLILAAALGLTAAMPLRPRLVWNASSSMPTGLYGVSPPRHIVAGDIVIARVPAGWRRLADARRYLPATVLLVKRVAGVSGDTVCAVGQDILINGHRRAERRRADGAGRHMPWWRGCVTLSNGAIFLLTASPASFDGRYFGPTGRDDVIGRAHLLWAR